MKKNFLLIAVALMIFTLQTTRSVAQQFIIGSKANVTTSTIVVPITCKNFRQYPGWQGSINWDNTKLTYASVATVASQFSGTSYNASVSDTIGRLSFIWFDNNTNPQTIPDSTVLFNITFNVVPNKSGNTDISFTNTPTALVLSNASFTAVSGVTYTKGTIGLTSALPQFIIGSKANITTSTIVVPITCKNFIQYPGWQGSVNWDNTKLTYASVATVASQFSGTSYNASVSDTIGRLSFIWFDNNTNPQTIPDSTVLFNITFNVVPNKSGNTDISFTNTPTSLVLSNASFTAVSGVTYTKGTLGLTGALPLTLQSFTASQQSHTITTHWQTTNEVNVSNFAIQRSSDGNTFTSIATISSTGGGNYAYTDQLSNLSHQPSTIYYRLKMVDKDGSYSYSKVVAVAISANRKSLVMYPNPVKDNLFVQLTSTKAEKLTLQVADLQGRILQQEDTQVGIGNVSLSVNTSALAKGTYVLLVKGSGSVQQKQFIKE